MMLIIISEMVAITVLTMIITRIFYKLIIFDLVTRFIQCLEKINILIM